jgi:hypothetical protein
MRCGCFLHFLLRQEVHAMQFQAENIEGQINGHDAFYE